MPFSVLVGLNWISRIGNMEMVDFAVHIAFAGTREGRTGDPLLKGRLSISVIISHVSPLLLFKYDINTLFTQFKHRAKHRQNDESDGWSEESEEKRSNF